MSLLSFDDIDKLSQSANPTNSNDGSSGSPTLTSIRPATDNVVITSSGGVTNLTGLAAEKAVEGQADVNKAVAQKQALMPLEAQAEQQKQIDTTNIKKLEFSKELNDFLTLDQAIPRGEGFHRFEAGANALFQTLGQDNAIGVATAAHNAIALKLRTSIARLKDVGNLSENEQKAAGQMIPEIFDSEQLTELKRAYLKQLGTSINSNQPSLVKQVMDSFKKSEGFDQDKHAQETNSKDVSKFFTRKSSLKDFSL